MGTGTSPRRRALGEIARYGSVGAATFLIDFGCFYLVFAVWGQSALLATTTGFWLSFIFNFLANKHLTFGARAGTTAQLVKYSGLVAANYLTNLLVVHAFDAAGLSVLVGKVVAVVMLTTINFFLYRYWVFRT